MPHGSRLGLQRRRADAAAAEGLAGQPIVGYSLGEELCAAVDTVPKLVKLPGTVGRALLLDLLPPRWAEVYASEVRNVYDPGAKK